MLLKQSTFRWAMISLLICLPCLWMGASFAKEEEEEKEEKPVVQGKKKNLTLALGVSRTLEFPFEIGPIFVTDPSLFDFRRVKDGEKDKKILIIPKSAGYTDMTIHDTAGKPQVSYYVRVTREEIGQLVAQLEELIGDIEGLKIKSVGGTVVIDGDILLPKDMIRIIRVVEALKDRDPKKKEVPIRNVASISKVTMNIIAERIEREIGSPEVTVRVLNNNILLEGTVQSAFEGDRAVQIAESYIPEVFAEKTKGEGGEVRPKGKGGVGGGIPTIIDLLREARAPSPAPESDIKITMNYVELSNEYDKTFNFEWRPLASDNSTLGYSSALGEFTANLVATVTSLLPKLVQARTHGHARILKQETLIVKNKAENPGVIESSIDFPVRQVNERGEASIQTIRATNETKVKASIIPGSDSMELVIQIRISNILGINQGAPIIANNNLQTQVTIKNGDSAALGGYSIDQALAGYNREPTRQPGAPGATTGGSSPLFNLQRSKQYQRNKQQYVIFVTPEVIRTAGAGTEDITRKFRLNAGER